ncbi:MAG: ammonium transporter [Phycisphaerae bacterium]
MVKAEAPTGTLRARFHHCDACMRLNDAGRVTDLRCGRFRIGIVVRASEENMLNAQPHKRHHWRLLAFMVGLLSAVLVGQAWAQDAPAEPLTPDQVMEQVKAQAVDLDTIWVMLAAFLVFWMQAGFGLVESGLTRAKNTVNILMKNVLDFCFASVVFWAVGFGIMFGAGTAYFGNSGFFLQEAEGTFDSLSWSAVSTEAKFFFQLVFAGTAATIVSGAVAERTKFSCYMIYSVIITMLIYPVAGHWIWGGGFLAAGGWFGENGVWDFAGSTVVHSVGGWIALCGAIVIGPRIGKYGPSGRVNAIPGHSFPLMVLGVFILWLGWFGFNPGSTMAAAGQGATIAHITLTTNAAAATGTIFALLTSKIWFGKWDASMAGNGCLAGLVAITAPCAFVDAWAALIIGAIGGVLVVLSVVFIDRILKIDDPVGATSVHLTNGIWGTLAVGIFANPTYAGPTGLLFGGGLTQLLIQLTAVAVVGGWCLVTGFALFFALKATMGLRVSHEEELRGLDIDEHGMEAYPDFVLATHGLPPSGGSSGAGWSGPGVPAATRREEALVR